MAGVTDSSREKEYQDLLLTLLDQEKSPELVKQKLLEDSRFKHLKRLFRISRHRHDSCCPGSHKKVGKEKIILSAIGLLTVLSWLNLPRIVV